MSHIRQFAVKFCQTVGHHRQNNFLANALMLLLRFRGRIYSELCKPNPIIMLIELTRKLVLMFMITDAGYNTNRIKATKNMV